VSDDKVATLDRKDARSGLLKNLSVPMYTYKVVSSWPHHSCAFTEGIVFHDGILLESGGLYASSSLMSVAPGSGRVLTRQPVPDEYFAEGLTVFNGRIYQLTMFKTGFIYDPHSFRKVGEFSYDGEGWGLTHDDKHLIMSDGSNSIRFINPVTFQTEKTINVTVNNVPLVNLNELEYVKGEIFANIWGSDYIVRIDPQSGAVVGWINLKGLLLPENEGNNVDVLNGIAYDEENDRLVVTGKQWSKFYEISLQPA
jgi:glutamine cyclotransferase